jgi:hypothetical protein
LLVLGGLEFGGEGIELLGFLVMGGLVIGEGFREGVEFGAEFVRFVFRWLGRDEGAGFEVSFGEGAVEPDAELPDDLECGECSSMVARERVVGGVPRSSDLAEELVDFHGEDAVVAEPQEEFVLTILRAVEDADIGGDELGEELGELAELEKAGVRILGEIPFRQHAETQELLIVRLQMGEVAAEPRSGRHRSTLR